MLEGLPMRGDGSRRPAGLPLPPAPMARWRSRRPLKRWRYVGIYGADVMLCAGRVRIGGLPQAFWAVWDRAERVLTERTALRGTPVLLPGGRVAVRDGDVEIELELRDAGQPVEVVSRHGRSYIWTRKQPVRACGVVRRRGRELAVDAAGLVDDSAGYHARRTAWEWCAGVGTGAGGEALTWNLVSGLHDAPHASERTLWVDGAARELEALAFAADLSSVGALTFTAEAQRARRDELLVLASDYRQPFGTFAGSLPAGPQLREGFGVMERHSARW